MNTLKNNELQNIRFDWDMIQDNLHQHLEFGVASGKSLNAQTRWIHNANPDQKFNVHGFDTFTGLPEDWVHTDGRLVLSKGDFYSGGETPAIDPDNYARNNIVFWTGLFSDTIPKYLAQDNSSPIAFLHIDCDLYSSTVTVLHSLNHLIVPGTIIRFDEWVYWWDEENNDHEARAFYEWVEEYNRDYRFFKQNPDNVEEKFVLII